MRTTKKDRAAPPENLALQDLKYARVQFRGDPGVVFICYLTLISSRPGMKPERLKIENLSQGL